jgi:hypothetical protein
MKTHRQHFVEILQTRDDPEGSSSDTARVSHLLLFCDMLDERENVWNEAIVKAPTTPITADQEDTTRLARLDAFYAVAYRLVGFIGADPNAEHVPLVQLRLEEQRKTMLERVAQLATMSLAHDELKRRVHVLEGKPLDLMDRAYLRDYKKVCSLLEAAGLTLCEGKDAAECVEAMFARIAELEARDSGIIGTTGVITCPICKRALTIQEIVGGSCNAGHAGSSDIMYSIRRQVGFPDPPARTSTPEEVGTAWEARLAETEKGQEPPSAAFSGELMERLIKAVTDAYHAKHVPGKTWMRLAVDAILLELSSCSCELPTTNELMAACGYDKSKSMNAFDAGSRKGIEVTIGRLGPILAAKDVLLAALQSKVEHAETDAEGLGHELNDAKKRIAELELHLVREKKFTELYELQLDKLRVSAADLEEKFASAERSVDWHRQQAIAATIELGHSGKTLEEAVRSARKAGEAERERIAELEEQNKTLREASKTFSDAVAHVGEKLKVMDRLKRQLTDLEKQLAEATKVPVDASDASVERVAVIVGENGGDSLSSGEMERIAKAMIVHFAKRVPVDASGKTPGDVYREAHLAHYESLTKDAEQEDFHRIYRESEDAGVDAVLQAFGNGAEALRSVRVAVDKAQSFDVTNDEGNNDWAVLEDDVFKIIDAELAKLEAPIGPNELRAHEFVCNENLIRGAFSWDNGVDPYVRPDLAFPTGRTMSFTYLAKQLCLQRGDIVEIRVLGRADR